MIVTGKAKHYLFGISKAILLSTSAVYIFNRLQHAEFTVLQESPAIRNSDSDIIFFGFGLFLGFATVNWLLESLKWKYLASTIHPISFKTAVIQTLASFSASVATPAKAGDYGTKALYFSNSNRKKIITLNLVSNLMQMAVTTILGLIAILFFLSEFTSIELKQGLILFLSTTVACLIGLYIFRNKNVFRTNLSFQKLWNFYAGIEHKIKLRVFLIAVIRYAAFSLMFYFLLHFFGMDLPLPAALMVICVKYFLVSVVPTFFVLDVVIRGGVAVWLFAFFGIPETIVLSAIAVMWIFNFLLPAIAGSYFVIRFKPVIE